MSGLSGGSDQSERSFTREAKGGAGGEPPRKRGPVPLPWPGHANGRVHSSFRSRARHETVSAEEITVSPAAERPLGPPSRSIAEMEPRGRNCPSWAIDSLAGAGIRLRRAAAPVRRPRSALEIEGVVDRALHTAGRRRELEALQRGDRAVDHDGFDDVGALLVELGLLHVAFRTEHEEERERALELWDFLFSLLVAIAKRLAVVLDDLPDHLG